MNKSGNRRKKIRMMNDGYLPGFADVWRGRAHRVR